MRCCSECGSSKTYVGPNGYSYWRIVNGKIYCRRCYERVTCKTPEIRLHNAKTTRLYYRRIKDEIISVLGAYCHSQTCPIPKNKLDIRCLQLDHLRGGGMSERRKRRSGWSHYLFYRNNPELAKTQLQVLCAYCNWLKRYTDNEVKRYD